MRSLAPPAAQAPDDRALDAKFQVFATLWSTCVLYDALNRSLAPTLGAFLVAAACVLVLLVPRSTAAFAAMGVVHALNLFLKPPIFVFVHWYIDTLVNAVTLLGWLWCAASARTARVDPAALLRAISPALRVLVLLAVGFAGFSKLNTMFLDPTDSCASALYLIQAQAPGFSALLPDATWARWVAIWLTVVAELGVPAAVLFPALRPVAIVLAAFFFFLLGINPVGRLYEFAGPMLALLFLFTADDLVLRVAERIPAGRAARWIRPVVTGALATGVAVLVLRSAFADVRVERALACRISWWVGVPMLTLLYLWNLPPRSGRIATGALFAGGAPIAWLVPVVMLANEVSAYVGFPHNTTFTMASDVRLMSGRSNHVLVRPPAPPGAELVRILEADTPLLRVVKKEGAAINWLTLREVLATRPGRLTFQVGDGPRETVEHPKRDPRFMRRPWLGRWFAYTEQPLATRCSHWPWSARRRARRRRLVSRTPPPAAPRPCRSSRRGSSRPTARPRRGRARR